MIPSLKLRNLREKDNQKLFNIRHAACDNLDSWDIRTPSSAWRGHFWMRFSKPVTVFWKLFSPVVVVAAAAGR